MTNLHETREPHQHAVLIEGGFMDSNIDITAMRRNDMLAAQGKAVAQAVVEYYGLGKGSSSTSTSTPKKSISKMATEVIRGKHGNGHANRQRSLGVNNATYQKVRAEVNRRL